VGYANRGLVPGSKKRFSLLQNIQTGSGAHPASFHGVPRAVPVKRLRRVVEHSPLTTDNIKNEWRYTPLYNFTPWTGTTSHLRAARKHAELFTIILKSH